MRTTIHPDGFSLNILLIDDDEDDFILIREMLIEASGPWVQVTWADTFGGAVQALRAEQWDAALVDYDLGAKTGIELMRAAQEEDVAVPWIMVTGRGSYEKNMEARQAGALDYLTKSDLSPPLLERTIRYAIERKRSEEMLEKRVKERTEELQTALAELNTKLDECTRQDEGLTSDYWLYKELFETAPAAYVVTDRIGKILEANRAAEVLLQGGKDTLIGKPLSDFIAAAGRADFRRELDQLLEANNTRELELKLQPPSRQAQSWWVIAGPLQGSEGEIQAIRWLSLSI